jgi:hypothetical protein
VEHVAAGLRVRAEWFAKWLGIVAGADIAVGLVWAELRGKSVSTSITEAFFISGGVIFVGAALTGGGARGRTHHLETVGRGAQEMPFVAVLIGLVLLGIGVLTIVL